jgi:hypothetical protein
MFLNGKNQEYQLISVKIFGKLDFMKRNQLLYWAIFAFACILGIETGAAIFVTYVVFPVWASSPEAATWPIWHSLPAR